MENINEDRRKSVCHLSFPFIDSEGNNVAHERRRNAERRKEQRVLGIAQKIINALN